MHFGQEPAALKLKSAGDTRLVAANARRIAYADVGGGIGTGRTSDGMLINDDHLAASSAPGRPAPKGVDELRHHRVLPDPATPVTHVSTPFGIRTQRLRRLLDAAFSMRNPSSKVRRLGGVGPTRWLRARDVAVSVSSRSSRRPEKTTLPPP